MDASSVIETLKKHILVDGFDMVVDLEESKGYWLKDSKSGETYLDFFSFFASSPLGFNHPKMTSDKEFLKHLHNAALHKVSNSDFYTQEYAMFVETFARVAIPEQYKYAFFISGGALAVENALKAAFDWKVRKNMAKGVEGEVGQQVIHFKEAFHGRSGYTMSLTNTADPRKYMYFPRFDWPRITNPKITFPLEENMDKVIELENKAIAEMEKAFADNPNDIAAILIEPIQSEGGDHHFRPEFFKELRRLADENEAMLIFDEIQTGVGLTGKMWAFEHLGVIPDLLVFGKKMQVCGFLSTERIDTVENNVFHESSRINSTWGGNLVDMVRAKRFLEIIEEDKLVENVAKVGAYITEKLEAMAAKYPKYISNIRGRGVQIAFDMPDSETRDLIKNKLFEEKVIALPCGHVSIRLRPVLTVDTKAVDILMERLDKVLSAI